MLLPLAINEVEVIREPGFAQWVTYLLVALIVADRIKAWFTPSKREVSGRLTTQPAQEPADAGEVDAELAAIKGSIESFNIKLDSVKKEITEAGQRRADAITLKIDTEVTALRENTEARVRELHDKINSAALLVAAHTAQIDDLRARDHSHDTQLMMLRTNTTKPR